MKRRRFLAAIGLGVAGAGCLDGAAAGELPTADREAGTEAGPAGTTPETEEACPRRTIEVYPAVEVPGGQSTLDPTRAGILAVDPIADALTRANNVDTDNRRADLDAETQTEEENRLAAAQVTEDHSETVRERLSGITYVTYQGRDYAVIFVYTAC